MEVHRILGKGLLEIVYKNAISTLSDYAQSRHTRQEAGIQCHGR